MTATCRSTSPLKPVDSGRSRLSLSDFCRTTGSAGAADVRDRALLDRLSGQSVALVLRQRAAAVGIEPHDLGAHSLRGYVEAATVFDDNAAMELGL